MPSFSKVLITLFLLFLPTFCFSQKDSSNKWIKIRSMDNNHSVDEWIREPPKDQRVSPLYIHDTIYVDSFRIGLLNHVLDILAKYALKNKQKDTIQYLVGTFNKITAEWRLYSVAKKKKHKTLDEYGGDVPAYKSQCPLDTIKGIIIYNSSIPYEGNVHENGMWVGCDPYYISSGRQMFMPGKNLWTFMNGYDQKKTIGKYYGRFITNDKKVIPNWRVYMLITSFDYQGSENFVITMDSETHLLSK